MPFARRRINEKETRKPGTGDRSGRITIASVPKSGALSRRCWTLLGREPRALARALTGASAPRTSLRAAAASLAPGPGRFGCPRRDQARPAPGGCSASRTAGPAGWGSTPAAQSLCRHELGSRCRSRSSPHPPAGLFLLTRPFPPRPSPRDTPLDSHRCGRPPPRAPCLAAPLLSAQERK